MRRIKPLYLTKCLGVCVHAGYGKREVGERKFWMVEGKYMEMSGSGEEMKVERGLVGVGRGRVV